MIKTIMKCAAAPFALGAILGLAPAHAEEEEGGKHKRHHVSVFLGGTEVFEEDHTGFTYGIDYEYELTRRFGVGFVAERAEGEIDATSILAVADIHLVPGFVLQVGPGVEFEGDEEFAIGRFGLIYEFEVGDVSISPAVNYDISEADDSLIFGILIGRKF